MKLESSSCAALGANIGHAPSVCIEQDSSVQYALHGLIHAMVTVGLPSCSFRVTCVSPQQHLAFMHSRNNYVTMWDH